MRTLYKTNQKGFSLIEALLSVALFGLITMGLTGGLIYGQQAGVRASHREIAVYRAQEGIVALQNMAEASFASIVDGAYGLQVSGGTYALVADSDTSDIYDRVITISSIDGQTKQIESSVVWSNTVFDEGDITFTTYVTDWQ